MSSVDELESLAEQARKGSSEAWAELYETNASAIFRLCRRALNNRQDADDATAAVFLKARRSFPLKLAFEIAPQRSINSFVRGQRKSKGLLGFRWSDSR